MTQRQLHDGALIAVAILVLLVAWTAAARIFPVDPAGLARAVEVQDRHTT